MTLIDSENQTRRCNRCHRLLPLGAFNPNPHFRDGLHGHCRECQEQTTRECEAIVAARDHKMHEQAVKRSPDEIERLRSRNLQYRRRYLEKLRAQRTSSSTNGK
jgi:hypothetical protein